MTGLLRMRKFASGLLLVGVLMAMTSVAATAASSNHSKATFSAASGIFAVGPGHLLGIPGAFSTIDVDVKSKGEAGIKEITIHTVDEGVLNDAWVGGPGTEITGCSDNDDGGACLATAMVTQGSAILSLHESTARLTNVLVSSFPVGPPEGPIFYMAEAYTGELRGKLRGDFVISGSTGPVVGEAKLQIKGSATYACFLPDATTPLPSVADCQGEGNPNLFLPMVLNVVDTGHFTAAPVPLFPDGPDSGFADPEHQLVNIGGKLQVTVKAAYGSLLDGSGIVITKAQAKFVSTVGVDDDDDDDHEGKGKKKDKGHD